MTLGDLIRIKRKENNLTLVELSKLTGISRPYLSQLEAGTKRNPSEKNIRILAESLGIDQKTLELLVETESAERLLTLKEQINIVLKELEAFQEYIAGTKSCIDKLRSIEISAMGKDAFYSPEQETLLRSIRESIVKTQLNLQKLADKQGTLGTTMNLLVKNLEDPAWPEPIGNIIREAETLGDGGLKYLEQQIKAIKELLKENQ